MTEKYNPHVVILSPDSRGRFQLKRYMKRPAAARWKVFVEDGGSRIVLEAIEEESE